MWEGAPDWQGAQEVAPDWSARAPLALLPAFSHTSGATLHLTPWVLWPSRAMPDHTLAPSYTHSGGAVADKNEAEQSHVTWEWRARLQLVQLLPKWTKLGYRRFAWATA